MMENTIFNIVQQNQVKDTGLWLLAKYFPPFVKTGMTLASLQSDITSPLDREVL
jgi:hypothetical protein